MTQPWDVDDIIACLHVVRRHRVALTDVILLDVQVPRQWRQHAEQASRLRHRQCKPGPDIDQPGQHDPSSRIFGQVSPCHRRAEDGAQGVVNMID